MRKGAEDPELVDIGDLTASERSGRHGGERFRGRSTVLIVAVVVFLVVLGVGAAWIAAA